MTTSLYLCLCLVASLAMFRDEDVNPVTITNAEGLIQLSNSVLNGENYTGTTVLLAANIFFTEEHSQ